MGQAPSYNFFCHEFSLIITNYILIRVHSWLFFIGQPDEILLSTGKSCKTKAKIGGQWVFWIFHPVFAKFLVLSGANPNAKDDLGRTPLHSAAITGTTEMVYFLVSRGSICTIKDSFGDTPADVAAKFGRKYLGEYLKRIAKKNFSLKSK